MIQMEAPAGVIERWQPELDVIAPKSDNGHAWLQLVWEPGDPWAPVNRWMIWDVMPTRYAILDIERELRGPNPRLFGHWDAIGQRFIRKRQFLISQAQWLFYHRTGYYGRPIWVCQGRRGGHLRHWSDTQSQLSLMNGGPPAPPAPGDLPYAEPDHRTVTKLLGMDLVRTYGEILGRLSSDHDRRSRLDSREREVARSMAEQTWEWLEEQSEDALDSLTMQAAQQFWDERATDEDWEMPDYDAEVERSIEELTDSAVS